VQKAENDELRAFDAACKQVELSNNRHLAKAQARKHRHLLEIACKTIYHLILLAYKPPHHHNCRQDSARLHTAFAKHHLDRRGK